jgi:hypothetical protein
LWPQHVDELLDTEEPRGIRRMLLQSRFARRGHIVDQLLDQPFQL